MYKTIGTPPCTLRQPWVSVAVTCDTWREINILLNFQVPSSYGFELKVFKDAEKRISNLINE